MMKPMELKPRGAISIMAMMVAMTGAASAAEIKIWSGYPEMVPFYEKVAEGLTAQHPDISVIVEAIPLREHEKRVALGLSSGSAGDVVVELPRSTATRFLQNDLLDKAPQNVADFVSDPANFGPFFLDAASLDGAVVGVPLFRGQGALFYNTDMFEAAGLSGAPATMAEYTDYASKLTQRDADGNPTVSGWSLRLSGGGQGIAEKFWINMFQFGGSLLEDQGGGMWRSNIADEAGNAALSQYLDNVYTLNNLSVEMPADAEAFERGQTAMFIRESWVIGDIAAKSPDLNYATAALPVGSIALPANLYVSAEGDASDAAWAFAVEANKAENLVWMLDNIGWLPNRGNVDYSSVTDKTPGLAGFVSFPDDYKFFTLPAIGPIEEILTRTAATLTDSFADESLAGDADAIASAMQELEDDINKILKREGLLAE
jgi:multiple sugar transport system substrate-binding protein